MRQGAGTLLVRTTGESPIGPERHAGRSLALCDGQGRSRGVLQGRPILRGMAEWTRQRGAGQRAKGDVTPASTDSPGAPSSLFLPNPHLPNPAWAGGLLSVRPSRGTTLSPERQDYLPRRESWPCGDWFSFSALLWEIRHTWWCWGRVCVRFN